MSKIIDVNGCDINELWLAEFRGFFFGEGYLGITTNGVDKYGNVSYTARVQISLRHDDESILKEIQSKLGGNFSYENRKWKDGRKQQNKVAVWRARHFKDVSRVCDILETGMLPSKKKNEIAVIRKFLKLHGLSVSDSIAEKRLLHETIKNMHSAVG